MSLLTQEEIDKIFNYPLKEVTKTEKKTIPIDKKLLFCFCEIVEPNGNRFYLSLNEDGIREYVLQGCYVQTINRSVIWQ